MLLLHELAHLRRRDSLVSLVTEILCGLLWFHPMIWRAAERVAELQEQSADDSGARAWRQGLGLRRV